MCRLMEYKNSNRSCDDCKTEIDAGAVGERCLQCEFDLCPGCSTGSAAAPSTHVGAHVSADASAPLDSVLTDAAPSLPDYDEVSSVSLLPEKMYSIFLPPKSSITASRIMEDANLETQHPAGKPSTKAHVVTSNPERNPNPAPAPRLNRARLKLPSSRKCNPPRSPKGAFLQPFRAPISSLPQTAVAILPPPALMAGPPSLPPVLAASPNSPSSADSLPSASPDSPVSRLEAFQKMCRLNPDQKFGISLGIQCAVPGISIGIQCSSPDPLFVDLRIPRPQLDGVNFYGVPIGRPTPMHPPFGHRTEPTFVQPTFDNPISDGERGKAADIAAAKYKVATVYVQNAQVVRQPRDGHCLYHALIHATGNTGSILQLRKELVGFIRMNYKMQVHGQPLETWIKWECLCRFISALLYIHCVRLHVIMTRLFSVEDYARKMLTEGAWGGGIELFCFSHSRRMNVHVYRVITRALSVIRLPCHTDRLSPTPYRADVSIWERVQENLLFQHPRCSRNGHPRFVGQQPL
jgi:hypothetical protein